MGVEAGVAVLPCKAVTVDKLRLKCEKYDDGADEESLTLLILKLLHNQEAFRYLLDLCGLSAWSGQKRNNSKECKKNNKVAPGCLEMGVLRLKIYPRGIKRSKGVQSAPNQRKRLWHIPKKPSASTLAEKCGIASITLWVFDAKFTFNANNLARGLLAIHPLGNIFIDRILGRKTIEDEECSEVKSLESKQRLRKFKATAFAVLASWRFLRSCGTRTPSYEVAKDAPYSVKAFRRIIDASAMMVYGHWLNEAGDSGRYTLVETDLKMRNRCVRSIKDASGK